MDGWLVGGGYTFDNYAGKVPYVDSSHTELFRIASVNEQKSGGLTMETIYDEMAQISAPVLRSYPKYLKAKGGGGDAELKMGIVDEYFDCTSDWADENCDENYSAYDQWSDAIMNAFAGYPCTDDGMTNAHISMIRGAEYWSGEALYNYLVVGNTEVAKWQSVYGDSGVPIGTQSTNIFFPDDDEDMKGQPHGYGNTYFFYGRVFITKTFFANQNMLIYEDYVNAEYFNTYGKFPDADSDFDINDMSGSGGDNNDEEYDCSGYDAYTWESWDNFNGATLPCNCYAEGDAFIGIALSQYYPTSSTRVEAGGGYESFLSPDVFDFQMFSDHSMKYINKWQSNHAFTFGMGYDADTNGMTAILEPESLFVKVFRVGNLDPNMGGAGVDTIVSVMKSMKFNSIPLAPAFVAIEESSGDVNLYYHMDPTSELGMLYTNLCAAMGNPMDGNPTMATNYCAWSLASDTAYSGCYADLSGNYQQEPSTGGFCMFTTLALAPRFYSTDAQIAYLEMANANLQNWIQTQMSNGNE